VIGWPTSLLGADVRVAGVAPPEAAQWRDLPEVYSMAAGAALRASPREAVIRIPEVATVSVHDGAQVIVDPSTDVGHDLLRTWLHGPVAVLVAGQQNCFALHATVIDIDGCRVALAGRRGAGKSTTALAAVAAGARLVADDVAVLDTALPDGITVRPFGRFVHSSITTMERLGLDTTVARPVPTGIDKVGVPGPASTLPETVECLVVIDVVPELSGVEVTPRTGVDAFDLVRRHTYRHDLVSAIWLQEWFRWQAAVVASMDITVMQRPDRWSVDEVVGALTELAHCGGHRD
jgi:hypothetical protein